MSKEFNLGVVGYCPPSKFDETEARTMINEGYDRFAALHSGVSMKVVSGLTNVGVLAIAYEEAAKRGWKTVGIACKKAQEHVLYPVDESHIVGENWGDESLTFVHSVDGLLRVGGGAQSKREAKMIAEKGGEVIEYELALITDETRKSIEKL